MQCLAGFVRKSSNFVLVASLLMCFVSSASADYRVSSAHTPSSSLDGAGSVSLDLFEYVPSGLEFDKKKNSYCVEYENFDGDDEQYCVGRREIVEYVNDMQLSKKVLKGSRYRFDNTISEYFKKAVRNELKFIGYKINKSSNLSIQGRIENFIFYPVSSNTDRILVEVVFSVLDKVTGKSLYNKKSTGEFIYSKGEHIDVTNSIYTATSRAIDNFVLSAQASGVLGYVE
jgi:hypothetical protein